ncbi:hypothetical protein [Streptacidiphilus sp. P02-A3a]|uniref:hypothetical protein n=1 Tax=Streptacidiphilus sp. P02-A3a TaxID=2704468 RepID=UPI0015FDCC12|nr:hypothetical protein [Streptacidiphilus sp. P02-A3a]QMU68907.1 hypothetical protein GXP74_12345 [Streptacidiphilus sp. P02-A3a]
MNPDDQYLPLDYSAPWPTVPLQVFARDIKTGVTKQLTHLADGTGGMVIANNWTLYYVPGNAAHKTATANIYQYSFGSQSSESVVSSDVDMQNDIFSIATSGPTGKRPALFNW